MGLRDLFKSKYEQLLDTVIENLENNMANNYKDSAQADLREFEQLLNEMRESKQIKEDVYLQYNLTLQIYKQRLEGYTHKDQKPYWTKED
ncbi:MAG: hypothetical protein K6F16_03085 [Lachnospiraceae bacterium]|nr:hypothetical protein [Lachnospiraceae bacterium]